VAPTVLINSISQRTVTGEEDTVLKDVVVLWEEEYVKEMVKQYLAQDVYNTDEIALFYKLMSNKIIAWMKCTLGSV
jgi:hypothetical protein